MAAATTTTTKGMIIDDSHARTRLTVWTTGREVRSWKLTSVRATWLAALLHSPHRQFVVAMPLLKVNLMTAAEETMDEEYKGERDP